MTNIEGRILSVVENFNLGRTLEEGVFTYVESAYCCVAGYHAHLMYEVIMRHENRSAVTLSRTLCEVHVKKQCDSVECYPRFLSDEPRCWLETHDSDGNSGSRYMCFGHMHFVFECCEYGTGWDAEKEPTPCDESCKHKDVQFSEKEARLIIKAIDGFKTNNPKTRKGDENERTIQ